MCHDCQLTEWTYVTRKAKTTTNIDTETGKLASEHNPLPPHPATDRCATIGTHAQRGQDCQFVPFITYSQCTCTTAVASSTGRGNGTSSTVVSSLLLPQTRQRLITTQRPPALPSVHRRTYSLGKTTAAMDTHTANHTTDGSSISVLTRRHSAAGSSSS